MAAFPVPERDSKKWTVCSLEQLPLDLKRVLSVQFREFIHHIEDAQKETDLSHNLRVVNFLERCLDQAA